MALKRPPQPMSMTLNLAPMVDVMMCLIIFFLIASRLSSEFKVDLPWALAAKTVEGTELGNRVTITIRRPASGSDDTAEYVIREWDGQQIRDRALLPEDIEALLKAQVVRAAQDKQPLRCVINADRMVMYKHVEIVLRACGVARIADIVFSVSEGRDPEEAVPS